MTKELQEVLDGTLDINIAARYLEIYLGKCSSGTWGDHIMKEYAKIEKKPNSGELMRNLLACTILLPLTDKSITAEVPENLLHRVSYFRQLKENDWFKDFQAVVKRDLEINNYRAEASSLGIIDPIEYQPFTRQAYNWLYGKAEDSGEITPESKQTVAKHLRSLVLSYGGAVICSIFTNHSEYVQKVHNWRTGYFFERTIFAIYEPEQVMKIKKQELAKSNTKLVKSIRVN
jgi:hypothetical protein